MQDVKPSKQEQQQQPFINSFGASAGTSVRPVSVRNAEPRLRCLAQSFIFSRSHSGLNPSFACSQDDNWGGVLEMPAECPVDHETRERWLEAAKTKAKPKGREEATASALPPPIRFSLDTGFWEYQTPSTHGTLTPQSITTPHISPLSSDREISTIPRALPSTDRSAPPANNERDTGHDVESGNWVYPSQEMFFNAMRRKGHEASAADMATIVPIHNAVNERAWAEITAWEARRGSDVCGGPKLLSFSGDSKALTPRARWNALLGYQAPFDRHDWVIDRCGKRVEYVIDFYSGKNEGFADKSLNFYLDVRPKLNSWEAVKTRALSAVGM